MCSVHFMKHDNKPSTCELSIHLQNYNRTNILEALGVLLHSDRGDHYVDFLNKFFSHKLYTTKCSHLKCVRS